MTTLGKNFILKKLNLLILTMIHAIYINAFMHASGSLEKRLKLLAVLAYIYIKLCPVWVWSFMTPWTLFEQT